MPEQLAHQPYGRADLPREQAPPTKLLGHAKKVFNVAWSPLLVGTLLSGSDDTTVRVWSLGGGAARGGGGGAAGGGGGGGGASSRALSLVLSLPNADAVEKRAEAFRSDADDWRAESRFVPTRCDAASREAMSGASSGATPVGRRSA